MAESCEHKFVHLETIRRQGRRPSWGIDPGQDWQRIDRFFCEKCLEYREVFKTEPGWEKTPAWW